MVEFFIFIVFLLLALLGLSEALCMLINWLLRPEKKAEKYLVIILTANLAEQQLLQVAESLNWHGNAVADRIIACTGNIDETEKDALERRFGSNRNIIFSNDIKIKGI